MTIMAEKDLDSSDVATLVRRAVDGDRKAWERLVSQYERLIWSITVEFKLVESDACRCRPDDLAEVAGAHRPYPVPGSCRLLARGHGPK